MRFTRWDLAPLAQSEGLKYLFLDPIKLTSRGQNKILSTDSDSREKINQVWPLTYKKYAKIGKAATPEVTLGGPCFFCEKSLKMLFWLELLIQKTSWDEPYTVRFVVKRRVVLRPLLTTTMQICLRSSCYKFCCIGAPQRQRNISATEWAFCSGISWGTFRHYGEKNSIVCFRKNKTGNFSKNIPSPCCKKVWLL